MISQPLVPYTVHCDSFKSNENSILKCSPKTECDCFFLLFFLPHPRDFKFSNKPQICILCGCTYILRDMQRDTGTVELKR